MGTRDRHEELLQEYEKELSRLQNIIDEKDRETRNLYDKNTKLKKEIEECKRELNAALDSLKTLAGVERAMLTRCVIDDQRIEFAGVKTYRDGWVFLAHNGKEIDATNAKDITIWSCQDTPLEVEVKL